MIFFLHFFIFPFLCAVDSPKAITSYEQNKHDEEVVNAWKHPPPPPQTCWLHGHKILYSFCSVSFKASWISSPKDRAFPETIPEEASSVEEERVVIFRIPQASCKPSYYTVLMSIPYMNWS